MSNTDSLKAIATTDWDESLQHVVDDMHGEPLNVHKLLANNPALLDAWWTYRKYSVNGGSLGKRNAEVIILRTAVILDSWYEWASHVVRGLESELSLDDIEAIRAGEGLGDVDTLLVAAVDELDQHRALHADTLLALSRHFSGAQVLDLISLVSTYTMLGCVLNTWTVELDGHVESRLPDGVDQSKFGDFC